MSDLQRFGGMRAPTSDFGAVLTDLQTLPFYYDVDLSIARSLAAGTQLVLPLTGNVLYVDQKPNSGICSLHFQDDARSGNTPFTIFPGFVARIPFTQLLIENAAQPGQIMRLIYGVDIDFVPAVSPGNGVIQVVDGGRARTAAGIAFLGGQGSAAGAGLYPHVEIWNPAASGKNCVIEQIMFTAVTTGGVVQFRESASALAVFMNTFSSKLSSGANSTMELYVESNAAPLGNPWSYMYVPADTVITVTFREPMVVEPGAGLIVGRSLVNSTIYANFEFYEETR
jgi:hypothetical protein